MKGGARASDHLTTDEIFFLLCAIRISISVTEKIIQGTNDSNHHEPLLRMAVLLMIVILIFYRTSNWDTVFIKRDLNSLSGFTVASSSVFSFVNHWQVKQHEQSSENVLISYNPNMLPPCLSLLHISILKRHLAMFGFHLQQEIVELVIRVFFMWDWLRPRYFASR